ncbi:hypothetical protein HN789_01785 [archaeon]|jgi:frataxin-like iron-binding protein CyaY|nr:hypothetical protein [archaeon]MBT4022545.1 hypothetical protein [archaeon]MBT4272871.1 hypothetical protein [archaeon]MBT4461671.1 hypothetical protein [archaeon]MBT4857561.1 hypothetical protein [archaeon]
MNLEEYFEQKDDAIEIIQKSIDRGLSSIGKDILFQLNTAQLDKNFLMKMDFMKSSQIILNKNKFLIN